MRESLERVWGSGTAALGGWVTGGGEFTLDIYRRVGYDYVVIDCQHSTLDENAAAAMLVRVPPGAPATLVRVSKNDAALLGKVADAGADGVIVPRVDKPEEARAAVAALCYAPRGTRSLGPIRPDLQQADLQALSERVVLFVMIESAAALANIDDICAVPGLTGVYIGPGDLSVELGLDPRAAFSTDQLAEPIARVRRACVDNGLILGLHQTDPVVARRWIDRGARLVTLGSDTVTFAQAATARLSIARGDGEV